MTKQQLSSRWDAVCATCTDDEKRLDMFDPSGPASRVRAYIRLVLKVRESAGRKEVYPGT